MLNHLIDGLTSATGTWGAFSFLVLGTLLGLIVGVIPGLSGVVVLSIALVFIYNLNLQQTLVFFLGVHAASTYSASISSILINTPAHAEAVPVGFDGFPMSRRGEGARALGLSAGATAFGAIVGGIFLVAAYYAADALGTLIHPPDMVAIILLAMFVVATLGVARVSKGLISVGIGFLLSVVGTSNITGESRFTFGSINLVSGISLVVVAIGAFAIPQMVELFGLASSVSTTRRRRAAGGEAGAAEPDDTAGQFSLRATVNGALESLRHWGIMLRSSVIGFVGGIIPGVGAMTTNYMSYGLAKQLSRKRGHLFGTGISEGVVAAEGSSVAKEEGSKVMTLGLGLPTGTSSALFIVALSIQGVKPGIGFIQKYPTLAYEAVWILVISALLGTVIGVLTGPWLARVTRVPGILLFPIVIAFCVVGTYVVETTYFALNELLFFAVVGVALRKCGYGLAAFMMGLVLGPTFEDNVYRTQAISGHGVIYGMWHRPSAVVITIIAFLVLGAKVFGEFRAARLDARPAARPARDAEQRSLFRRAIRRSSRGARRKDRQLPLLELIITLTTGTGGVIAAVYSHSHFSSGADALPVLAGVMMALGALWQLPGDLMAVVQRFRPSELASRREAAGRPAGMAAGEPFPTADAPEDIGADEVVPVGTSDLRGTETPRGVATLPAQDVAAHVAVEEEPARVVRGAWGWRGQYTREVVALLWVVGAIEAGKTFGFRVGTLVFVVAYSVIAIGRTLSTWRARIVFGIVASAVLYAFVAVLFQSLSLTEYPTFDIPAISF